MNTFSFRAELGHDPETFVKATKIAGFIVLNDKIIPTMFTDRGIEICPEGVKPTCPDVYFQMDCNATLEELRTIMRTIIDSHIMIETMRQCPLSENSLERDHSVQWYKKNRMIKD